MSTIPQPVIAPVSIQPFAAIPASAVLDGTGSLPSAGGTTILTYQWVLFEQPTGAGASLLNDTTDTATIIGMDEPGSYGVALYVTDNNPDPDLDASYDSYLPRQLSAGEDGLYGKTAGSFVGPVPTQIVWVRVASENAALVKPGRGDRGWFEYIGGLWSLYDLVDSHEASLADFVAGAGYYDDIYEKTVAHGIEMHHEVTMSAGALTDTISPVSNNSAVAVRGSGAHTYDLKVDKIGPDSGATVEIIGLVVDAGSITPPGGVISQASPGTATIDMSVDDQITLNASSGVYIPGAGGLSVTEGIATDLVVEYTTGEGVTVDAVRAKDGNLEAVNVSWNYALSTLAGLGVSYFRGLTSDPCDVVFPGGGIGTWSLGFWTHRDTASDTILGMGGTGTTELRVRVNGADTEVTDDVGNTFGVSLNLTTSPTYLVSVVLTCDGSDLKAYVNGVQVDAVAVTGTFDAVPSLKVFARHDATDILDGLLRGLAVWDSALSLAAVQSYHRGGPGLNLNTTTGSYNGGYPLKTHRPVFWWGGQNGLPTNYGTGNCGLAAVSAVSAAQVISASASYVGHSWGTFADIVYTDLIRELTAGAGVTIDGALVKDGGVQLIDGGRISVSGGPSFVEFDGTGEIITVSAVNGFRLGGGQTFRADYIGERTPNVGVTVDGVLLKDGALGTSARVIDSIPVRIPGTFSPDQTSGNISGLAEYGFNNALQIAANTLKAGDVVSVYVNLRRISGTGTGATGFTARLRLNTAAGSVIMATSGTWSAMSNLMFRLDIIVLSIGAAGTLQFAAQLIPAAVTAPQSDAEMFTVDTTATISIVPTFQWTAGTPDAGDVVYRDYITGYRQSY